MKKITKISKVSKPLWITHLKLSEVKRVLDRVQPYIMQIAFGVVSPMESHPEIWDIFAECRSRGIVPNVTINQRLNEETAKNIAKYCGAVAVSVNADNKEIAYDAIKLLSVENRMKQVNIHYTIHSNNYDFAFDVMKDMKTDSRLINMNALVFLSLKQKGAGKGLLQLSQEKFETIVDYAMENELSIGFDSCGAHKFLESVKNRDDYERLKQICEPCEQSLFSSYINVFSEYFPCSFIEGENGWENGINVANCYNFIENVWMSERVKKEREKLLKCSRNCPYFKI